MIDHVNALVLPVRDVRKCAEFYRDKLGLSLDELHASEAFLRTGPPGGLVLALLSMERAAELMPEAQLRPREPTVHRTYFAVFVDDVDREYDGLRQKGVHFVTSPTTGPDGWRDAFFEDPEGNLWEISQSPQGT